jgi:hypothetical protein
MRRGKSDAFFFPEVLLRHFFSYIHYRVVFSFIDATYLQWLAETGFVVVGDRFMPQGESGHTLTFCEKPE